MQQKAQVVTIDGPAASGKSSVSRELAKLLGWSWVSTGAFYRGLAFVARAKGVSFTEAEALAVLANNPIWQVRMTEKQTLVFLDNQDVSAQVYAEAVAADASKISQISQVRESLLKAQRNCQLEVKGLVAEGRDCGSVIFPNALVKIYLTADSENRARRRARDEGQSLEQTQAEQSRRDHQDSTRQAAPLQIPQNAVVIDTSDLTLPQVVQQIHGLVVKALEAN